MRYQSDIYSDPDDLIVVRGDGSLTLLKDVWPEVQSLHAATESGEVVPLKLLSQSDFHWAHKEIDLDGRRGHGLAFWGTIEFECDSKWYEALRSEDCTLIDQLVFMRHYDNGVREVVTSFQVLVPAIARFAQDSALHAAGVRKLDKDDS